MSVFLFSMSIKSVSQAGCFSSAIWAAWPQVTPTSDIIFTRMKEDTKKKKKKEEKKKKNASRLI